MPVLTTDDITIDDTLKGVPWGTGPLPITGVGDFKWRLLAEDLPLPLAVLKQTAMDTNSAWMRRFLETGNAVLAPHGKTTMCPQLFERQLADGAWAITLANTAQMQVARRFGVSRIFLANQLVGRAAIKFVFEELRRDGDFDFFCIVDTVEGVAALAGAAEDAAIGRPLQVLVEGGVTGRRTGARSLAQALAVARAVNSAAPHLALRGVEGFEGVVVAPSAEETALGVRRFVTFLGDVAMACVAEDLFADGPVILSAGGSAHYDLAAEVLCPVDLGREKLLVIRSGCYLSHDTILYRNHLEQIRDRTEAAGQWGTPPRAALEVWAYVQSRPEPGRVIVNLGKRDASYDAGLPKPLHWARPGAHPLPQAIASGHVAVEVNDQHLFMDVPDTSPLRYGDMVGFGISHPCLTFDKWQFIPVVDDTYTVISAVRTFF